MHLFDMSTQNLTQIENLVNQESIPWNAETLGDYGKYLDDFFFDNQHTSLNVSKGGKEVKSSDGYKYISIEEGTLNSYEVKAYIFEHSKDGDTKRELVLEIALVNPSPLLTFLKAIHGEPDNFIEHALLANQGNPLLKTFGYSAAGHYKLCLSTTENLPNFVELPNNFEGIKSGLNIPVTSTFAAIPASILSLLSINNSQDFMLNLYPSENGEAIATLYKSIGVSTGNLAGFSLDFSQVGVSFSLFRMFSRLPEFSLLGNLNLGGSTLNWEADLDITHKALRVTLTEFPSFEEAVTKFGFSGIEKYFNTPIETLGELRIEALTFEIALEGTPSLYKVEATIGTEDEVTIIPNIIKTKLGLDIQIYQPLNKKLQDVSARLFGQWALGSTYFDTYLSYPEFLFAMQMGLGQSLDTRAFTRKILPGVPLPPIQLLDLDIEGNLKDKSFEASLGAALDWELKFTDDESLSIEDINFEIFYEDNKVQDVALVGRFKFIDLYFQVQGHYAAQGGGLLEASTQAGETIPIGTLIEKLALKFGDITLPEFLADSTLQDVSMSLKTASKDMAFWGTMMFPVTDQKDVTLALKTEFTHLHNGHLQKTFAGHIILKLSEERRLIFDLKFQDSLMLAAYHEAQPTPISLAGLLAQAGIEGIPDTLEISLRDAVLVHTKENESKNLFVVNVDGGLNLSHLPLIGKMLPADQNVVLNVQLMFAQAKNHIPANSFFNKDEVKIINGLLPEGIAPIGEEEIKQDKTIEAKLQIGQIAIPMELPLEFNANASPSANSTDSPLLINQSPDASQEETTTTKWFDLQKKIGPIHFNRLGVGYQNGDIKFSIDASFALSALTIELMGLSVSSSLAEFKPHFDLRGLGIDFKNDTLEISGALLRQKVKEANSEESYDEYDGQALLKTAEFTLGALGSYAKVQGHPSLFMYASLNKPIGGPAAFFVTGLSAGVGYNRSLKMPSIHQVAQFPLVAQAGEAIPKDAGKDYLTAKLEALHQYLPPTIGHMFLVAGVSFTSFELVKTNLILNASFGNRFELDLLGMSTLVVPPDPGDSDPLAVIQMAIKGVFVPEEGVAQLRAALTPDSYVLSKKCHLEGEFAAYMWFKGAHKDDFVITMGGYHPLFQKPAHYPTVPRLTFDWQVDDDIDVKGDMYFALCAHALMAGGHLEATYHSGHLKAWFKAGADFMIAWQPYHYDASMYVDIGASYTYHFFGTHHITVDVGADLHLWGPEFGGHARIHIWKFHLNVNFGDQSSKELEAITWEEFKGFLPAKDKLLSVRVSKGVVIQGQDDTHLGSINAKEFTLMIESFVPSKTLKTDLSWKEGGNRTWDDKFGIAPMEKVDEKVTSTLTIQLQYNDSGVWGDYSDHIEQEIITKKVPAALWGTKLKPDVNDPEFVENAFVGLKIIGKESEGGVSTPISRDAIKYETNTLNNAIKWEGANDFEADTSATKEDINQSIVNDEQSKNRNDLLALLDVDVSNIDLSNKVANDFILTPQVTTI